MIDAPNMLHGLADYVARLSYADLPSRVVEVARQCILDAYGNMVCGRYGESAGKIMRYAELAHAVPAAEPMVTLLGTDGRASCKEAVIFAHTMMARCADLDDGYRHAMGHPGASLVPLALSLAQVHGLGGRDITTALVAGYDIYARLGEAMNPNMYRERGFESTGVCGAVAAAAMAAKMAGGDRETIRNAMGLASLFTGGLIEYQNDGTSGKIMCGGWGALTGLRAARLAACGFTGPVAALEGPKGYFQAFKGTSGYLNTDRVLADLGKDFKITSIYFKRHACMRGLHAVLDAILELRERHGLTAATVKAVDVRTSSFVLRLSNKKPATLVSAQNSVEFVSAVMLKYGRVDSEKLLHEAFQDAEVAALVERVTAVRDETVQEYLTNNPTHFGAALVAITTTGGEVFEKWSPVPVGDEESPFGWDVLRRKFDSLIAGTPFTKHGDALFSFIRTIDSAESIDMLLQVQA